MTHGHAPTPLSRYTPTNTPMPVHENLRKQLQRVLCACLASLVHWHRRGLLRKTHSQTHILALILAAIEITERTPMSARQNPFSKALTWIAHLANIRLSRSVFLKMFLLILGECLKFKKIVLDTKKPAAPP